MVIKVSIKKIISVLLALLLFFNNFAYAESMNHWAQKNYESLRQKNVLLEEDAINLDRDISLTEFEQIFKHITNLEIDTQNIVCNEEALTRIDVINLLAKTLPYEKVVDRTVDDFVDSHEIDGSIKDAVNKILSIGIINGFSDVSLRVHNKITLGEAITVIKRVSELNAISSISANTVSLANQDLEMGLVSKTTNNTISLFILGSLLNEKLLNMDINKQGIEEWIKTRDEAIDVWNKAYKNSMVMYYSTDKYLSDMEEKMNNTIIGAQGGNLEWAKKITEQYDAIKNAKKLKTFAEELGVDARKAFEILKISQAIVKGDAIEEEAFFEYLEIFATATKTASKVGLFIGGTILTAGAAGAAAAGTAAAGTAAAGTAAAGTAAAGTAAAGTAAAGTAALVETAGIVVSGIDVLLELGAAGSNIIVGEDSEITIGLEYLKEDYGVFSAIFGLTDLASPEKVGKMIYLAEQFADLAEEGKILGIKCVDNADELIMASVEMFLEQKGIPVDSLKSDIIDYIYSDEARELINKIVDKLAGEKTDDTPKDADDIIEELDINIEDIDKKYDESVEEIEEIEDKKIDDIIEEIEKKIDEEKDKDVKNDNLDKDESDNKKDKEDKEDKGDKEDKKDMEDKEDPEEPEDPDDIIYYTLTIYYTILLGDEEVEAPPTFIKKDYKHGDKYIISTPRIEGYTPDRETVEGTMSRDETITVEYMKDYKPTYTLIINYVIDDKSIDPPAYHIDESLKEGDEYSVTSPTIEGYYPDTEVVSGTMTKEDKYINVIVTYYSEVKTYTLTINYIYENEDVAAPKHEKRYKVGEAYDISSPIIDGYYASTDRVSGTMGEVGNIVVTVTYRENPSADEEEISGVVDLDTVRIPEGTSLDSVLEL